MAEAIVAGEGNTLEARDEPDRDRPPAHQATGAELRALHAQANAEYRRELTRRRHKDHGPGR